MKAELISVDDSMIIQLENNGIEVRIQIFEPDHVCYSVYDNDKLIERDGVGYYEKMVENINNHLNGEK